MGYTELNEERVKLKLEQQKLSAEGKKLVEPQGFERQYQKL
jgi:hypothetical protein